MNSRKGGCPPPAINPHDQREVCLYINRGAKWQELTAQQLTQRLKSGQVWGLKQNDCCQSMAIQSYLEGSNKTLWIGFATGDNESLPKKGRGQKEIL